MKRHEYLYSALAAFGAALVFIVFGAVVLHVLNPYLDAAEIGFMFFKMIPIAFIAIGAVFAVIGAYALVNERMIENGEVIAFSMGARMNEKYYDVVFYNDVIMLHNEGYISLRNIPLFCLICKKCQFQLKGCHGII